MTNHLGVTETTRLQFLAHATVEELTNALAKRITEEQEKATSAIEALNSADTVANAALEADWTSVTEALRIINNAERSISQASLRPRRLLNNQTPFLQLPEEIILEIFHEYVEDTIDHPENDDTLMHGADWYLVRRLYLKKYTCITHICSRLRDVAIQDARLWSDIDLLWPPQVMEEFALRAKDCPLSLNLNLVRYHHDPTHMPHILDQFTIAMSEFWIPFYEKNVDRVRHLTFHNRIRIGEHGSNFREFHLLRGLWKVIRALPAPKLETCYLEAQPWERIDNLFSGHAPLLQSIVLASPFLGLLGLEKFESLVSLDLSGINNEPEQSDLPDIRVILSHVPQLQRLSISCSRLFKDSELAFTEMGSTSKNELSNCSKLVLQDLLATDIIHLLSIISFPALENLCIEAYITEASQTTLVYSSFPSRFVDLCSRSREVRFEVQNNIIFMEAGSSVDKPRTLEFLGRLCDVAVEGIAQFAMDSLTAPFKTLKMRPTTLGLRFMETLDEEIYSTKFWKTVFACAPKLVNLVNVQSVPSMPFIEALDELDVICPSLRRIRYDSAQQPFKPDIEDDTDLPMRQKQQDAVRRFFQQRKERRKERKRSMKPKQGEGSMAPPLPQQSR